MYSREKFQKAIELYLKYDKSVASVIRELGYPSRKLLPRWYKRYLKEQETGIVRRTLVIPAISAGCFGSKRPLVPADFSAGQYVAEKKTESGYGRITRGIKKITRPCLREFARLAASDDGGGIVGETLEFTRPIPR